MARPKRKRRVQFMPEITYFKPIGVPLSYLKEIDLSVDELEALRLVDYKGKDQETAAEQMNISQSTIQRILSQARKKLARALVMGWAIKVEGGEVDMRRGKGSNGRGRGAGGGRGRMGGPQQAGPGGYCSCPNPECDHQEAHQPGQPCYKQVCPKCGSQLIRKREQ
jgi:hypothetical protein